MANQQAMDALRALAQGGSQGYDQYQQARNAEQASRTSALDAVLGGDAAQYVANMRAQYSPAVSGPSTDPGALQGAYDSYVSQGAAKLANQAYEAQQQLALDKAKMDAQQNQITEQQRLQMLQGAAQQKQDAAHQQVTDQYNQQLQQLNNGGGVVDGRGNILRSMAGIDQQIAALNASQMSLPGAPATPNPDVAAQVAGLEAQKQGLQTQLGQYDADARNRLAALAQMAGKDANGLNAEYQKFMDTGDATGLNNLVNYVKGAAQPLLQQQEDQNQRAVDVSQQKYLRDLAPAFGINPLQAAGMFPDFKGDPLQQVQQRQAYDQYVSGQLSPADQIKQNTEQQKLLDQHAADVLGFDDPAAIKSLRTRTKMDTNEIQGVMQSPDWAQIGGIADNYYYGNGNQQAAGYQGFQQDVTDYLKSQKNPDGTDKYKPADVARFKDLVDAYYGNKMRSVVGSDKLALQ